MSFKKILIVFISILAIISVFVLFKNQKSEDVRELTIEDLKEYFYSESKTQEELKIKYQSEVPVKVLIVAGHTDKHPGAIYRNKREVDMNVLVSNKIFNLLKEDANFKPVLFQEKPGVINPEINTLLSNSEAIQEFKVGYQRIKEYFEGATTAGITNYSPHSSTEPEIIEMLYGINWWSNENDVDIVIHVHFNDVLSRQSHLPGFASGFAIYVNGDGFKNSQISQELAGNIFESISEVSKPSNSSLEEEGIIKDKDLIAVGAYNTLGAASVLIEYGYIYEDQFKNPNSIIFDNLAKKTYEGLVNFLD